MTSLSIVDALLTKVQTTGLELWFLANLPALPYVSSGLGELWDGTVGWDSNRIEPRSRCPVTRDLLY